LDAASNREAATFTANGKHRLETMFATLDRRPPLRRAARRRSWHRDAVEDRRRFVTLTAFRRAADEGFVTIGASNPPSGPFRANARASIVEMAASGNLTVPVARAFAFDDARDAVAMLAGPHPSGKLALVLGV
jgi:Zinc-binding dehydrogenase